MKPTYLAIISGIILSLDQVLIKLLINKITISKFESPLLNSEEVPKLETKPNRRTTGKIFKENLRPSFLKCSKPFDIA